jgi:hypothetical protein
MFANDNSNIFNPKLRKARHNEKYLIAPPPYFRYIKRNYVQKLQFFPIFGILAGELNQRTATYTYK